MTLSETILLYVGFGIVLLFFLAFVSNCIDEITKLERRQNENNKKK